MYLISLVSPALIILLVELGFVTAKPKCDAVSQLVLYQCKNFNPDITIESFYKFTKSFDRLNECIGMAHPESEETEAQCEMAGFLYPILAAMNHLIDRLLTEASICGIEYSTKIYHLHNLLVQIESRGPRLLRVLHLIMKIVATGCRSVLTNQLAFIIHLVPNIMKRIDTIKNYVMVPESALRRSGIRPEKYIPILESEIAYKFGVSKQNYVGARFRMTKSKKYTLEKTKAECKVLQPFYVNLIGSLGLMASLGHTTSIRWWGEKHGLVRKWLIVARVCQSIKTIIIRVASTNRGMNELIGQISPIQEPDVSLAQEKTLWIDGLKLPKFEKPLILKANYYEANQFYSTSRDTLFKLRLLTGPDYKLSEAIHAYLDKNLEDRETMLKELLDHNFTEKTRPVEQETGQTSEQTTGQTSEQTTGQTSEQAMELTTEQEIELTTEQATELTTGQSTEVTTEQETETEAEWESRWGSGSEFEWKLDSGSESES